VDVRCFGAVGCADGIASRSKARRIIARTRCGASARQLGWLDQNGEPVRREHRLRRGSDFERVRANRKSWAHPFLVCYACAQPEPGLSRVGIVVGRRVGNAVVRNRVKRRIREAIRACYPQVRSGFDVILIARGPSATAGLPDLEGAIAQLFSRARLWQPRETLA
jgi:ribonuclease P protein component